jgi:hypothetical protein
MGKRAREERAEKIERWEQREARSERLNKRHKQQRDECKIQRNSREYNSPFDRYVSRAAMGYALDESPDY